MMTDDFERPVMPRDQYRYDVEHGARCCECGESFSVTYGGETMCTSCWNRTAPLNRIGFIRAERDTEESVIIAKQRHHTPHTEKP